MTERATPGSTRVQEQDLADALLAEAGAVHRFALHLTREAVRAEDLAQETYLRSWTRRDQFQPGTSCRAWLFTICRHAFLKGEARGAREVAVEDAELEALGAAALHASVQGSDPVGAVFERSELDDAVQRALLKLPEEYRAVVTLVDIEDRPYAAAARILGVPMGTVRSRLFRARRLLQQDLLAYAEDAGLLTGREESEWCRAER
ncbi:MAG: sigma-70 family RNA polymerase sigma factor [Gemmatimonadales bacterium]